MGYGSALDLLSGIFKRWFSKEATEEARANDIEKLEREQADLALHNVDGRNDKRLRFISGRLSYLQKRAKNAR